VCAIYASERTLHYQLPVLPITLSVRSCYYGRRCATVLHMLVRSAPSDHDLTHGRWDVQTRRTLRPGRAGNEVNAPRRTGGLWIRAFCRIRKEAWCRRVREVGGGWAAMVR